MSQFFYIEFNFIFFWILKNIIFIIFLYLISKNNKIIEIKYNGILFNSELKENIKYTFSEYAKNITNSNNIFFKFIFINYNISPNFNMIKVEYDIYFYDENQILINPSNMILNNELHIICHIQDIQNQIDIDSLPNIKENTNYNCIQYFRLKEKIKFGIKIFKNQDEMVEINTIYFFSDECIKNHYFSLRNDDEFNYFMISEEFKNILKKIENNNLNNKSFLLESSFIEWPIFKTKKEIAIVTNKWYYRNIYNKYFCFCKGSLCLFKKMNQKCKYRFYLNQIFNSRNLYKKTHYLFADNLITKISEDYAYSIFLEMLKQNLNAHYMTDNENIYNNFYYNNSQNLKSFKVIKEKKIDGDFIEKYFELILRLKVVLAAFDYLAIDNIFYNIEFITYIFLGHGVHFFKHFLYGSYHSCQKYNKILVPNSQILISIAKNYGWKDEDIIKQGLPKWDKYKLYENGQCNNRNIFLMFTWRKIKEGMNISPYYLNNTFNLLSNKYLNKKLKNNNISLFFTFHHMLKKIDSNIFKNLKNYEYIIKVPQSSIFQLIANSSLFISDFSSVIFDFIYLKKPFVMFVPDSEDPKIKDIYSQSYYDIIEGLRNNSIYFENKFFDLNKAIDKIIYYIDNNFNIERNIRKFYKTFNLSGINNTNTFIEYLKNIK